MALVFQFNLDEYFVGGLTTAQWLKYSEDTKTEIQNKYNEVIKQHPFILYDNKNIPLKPHDVIYICNPYSISIFIPNGVKSKQTLKSKGIIVCDVAYLYRYMLDTKKWEFQNFEK